MTLAAVARRMPPTYAFSGRTAGWLLGLDMSPCDPVEVTIDRAVPVRARAGIRLRRAALPACDVAVVGEFRVTSALRTSRDLGSTRDRVDSVVALEAALRSQIIELQTLADFVATHPGEKGFRRLRRSLKLVEPSSESPMETRLRMLLIEARLPAPVVQATLHDGSGQFVARADLYYPDRRLVIEYDGDHHRDRLVGDMRRQNALFNAGYHLLRFTAADLRLPGLVASQVRQARARLPRIRC